MPRLTASEAALTGYTDRFSVNHFDLQESVAGEILPGWTYFRYSLPAYAVIHTAILQVTETFSGIGTVNIRAGINGNEGGLIPSGSAHIVPTTSYNSGSLFGTIGAEDNQVNGYTTGSDYDVLLGLQGTTGSLNDLTSGAATLHLGVIRLPE